MDRKRPQLMMAFLTEIVLLLPQEMVPPLRKVVMKLAKEGVAHVYHAAHSGHSAKRGSVPSAIIFAGCVTKRSHGIHHLIFARVLGFVLLVEDVVPGLHQIMPFEDTWNTNHLSVKWLTRLCTMGPSRLRLTSDQPILELFVRSTGLRKHHVEAGLLQARQTFVLVPILDIIKVHDSDIIVILAGEDNSVQVERMCVRNRMA